MNQIKNIAIGSFPNREFLKHLKTRGFTSVLTLVEVSEGAMTVKKMCQNIGLEWSHAALKSSINNGVPTCDQLMNALKILDKWTQEGKKIYVHCSLGTQRAPTVLALYLCAKHYYRLDQAIEKIKEVWPNAKPNQAQRLMIDYTLKLLT